MSKNQRFEEARQWFHYIFDPTDTSSDPSPARYWRFRPFRESPGLPIEDLIQRLADPTDHSPEKLEFQSLIAQWKDDPFKPHLVARMRLRSYMYAVVMKYLDNLIDWAEQLFRRDTMESLNEATQLYVLASQILGRRPERLPHRTRPKIQSYTELAAAHPDDLTNALVDAENLIPRALTGSGPSSGPPLQSLYFCIPSNPKSPRLLRSSRGPALQAAQLHEHRRRRQRAAVVLAGDRSRAAREGGRCGSGRRIGTSRFAGAAAALSIQCDGPESDRAVRRSEVAGRRAP